MSRQRLDDIKNALVEVGWEILNEAGDNRWHRDIYRISESNNSIYWGIRRLADGQEAELVFFLTSSLGGPTKDLRDLFTVSLLDSDFSIFFDKINSREWKDSLQTFSEYMKNIPQ